jgi:hypothetical protein
MERGAEFHGCFHGRRSFVSEPLPDNSERFRAGREAPGRFHA